MQYKVNTKNDWKRICNLSQNGTFSNMEWCHIENEKSHSSLKSAIGPASEKNQIIKGNTENWLLADMQSQSKWYFFRHGMTSN